VRLNHPAFPAPSDFSEGEAQQSSGKSCREKAKPCRGKLHGEDLAQCLEAAANPVRQQFFRASHCAQKSSKV
jgi:hypothetical protein